MMLNGVERGVEEGEVVKALQGHGVRGRFGGREYPTNSYEAPST